jgi:hypothetical protein
MFVEAQISTNRLFEQLREGLREAIETVVVQEWSAAGQTLMFDHIEVRDATSLEQPERPNPIPKKYDDWPYHQAGSDPLSAFPDLLVEATPIIIRQTLDLFPVVLLGGGSADPQLVTLPTISFSFSVEIDLIVVEEPVDPKHPAIVPRTKPALVVTPFLFDFQPIPQVADVLGRAAEDALASAIGSQVLDIPLAEPLQNLNFVNAGITSLGGGSRIGLKWQAGFVPEVPTRTQWEAFYAGQSPDLTDPQLNGVSGPPWDWAIEIDRDWLQTMINSEATTALKHPTDNVWLANRGLQVDLRPFAGHLQLALDAPFDVATGVLGVMVTVEIDVVVDLELDQNGDLLLTANGRASVDVPLEEALLAAVAGAALGAMVSVVIAVVPGAVFYLIRALIEVIDLIGTVTKLPVLSGDLAKSCSEDPFQIDLATLSVSKRIVCRIPASQPIPLSRRDQAELKQLFVLGDQVVAAGTLTPLPHLPRPTWSLVAPDGLWYAPRVACADVGNLDEIVSAFRANPRAARCVSNIFLDVVPSPTPTTSVSIVRAWIASNNYGLASCRLVDQADVEAELHFDSNFVAQPRPIFVLVHTTDGVRLIQLPAPPPFNLEQLTASMLQDAGECRSKLDDFYRRFGRYNVKWGIDPPFRRAGHRELWGVRVTGLNPNEEIAVVAVDGELIASSAAGLDGSVEFTHLALAGSPESGELELRRSADAEDNAAHDVVGGAGATSGAVRVLQQQLLHQSQLDIGDRLLSFDAGRIGGRELLVITRHDSLDVYDLSRPDRPSLVASLAGRDYRGARIDNGSILAWGEGGLERLLPGESLAQLSPRTLVQGRVKAADSLQESIVALTSEGLVTLERATGRMQTNGNIQGDLLATADDAVVVASRDELDVFIGSAAEAEPASRLVVSAEQLYTSRLAGSSRVIAESREGAVEIDVADPRSARIANSWSSTPEHVHAATTGVVVATRDNADGTISILTRAQRRQV